MQRSVTIRSLFVFAAFTLGAHCAHAEDHCFEDGLKNSWSTPAPSIQPGHSEGGEHSFEHHAHHHFGGQHHFDMDGHPSQHTGTGIGVSPVSEPATDAMLLTGLAMLLTTLARRTSKSRRV